MSKPPRILIVEDESIVQLDIRNSLQFLGYEVVGTVSTGEEGIAQAEQCRPDLVLMDIILKGSMDGVRAAEQIRSRLGIPVIFLTACADDKTLHRAKVSEPFGYVLKPFEQRELHGHIEIALYKHTMEKRLRESEERYSLATQGANDGLWDWNLQSKEIYYSPRWKTMLGYEEKEITLSPQEWFNRLHPEDKSDVYRKLADHLRNSTPHFECEYRILDQSGSYRWMLCRGLAIRDKNGNPYRVAGSQTDITDRKVYNPLTGLPNRTLLMDRLERALERSRRHKDFSFALLALDVDDWKIVNDSLGCIVADQLLIQIAKRLQGCLQPQDTAAHFGHDDFVLLLDDVRDATDATLVAARIHRQLQHPFSLSGNTIYVTSTIGITLSAKRYREPAEVLQDAYTAMHRAKKIGKGRCEIFDEDMRSSAMARLRLECDLRKALKQKEFRVYYQPIVSLLDGSITGFEALVRWQRRAGLTLPQDFLPLAESTELIIPLEKWVLSESCRQLAAWTARLGPDRPLNLNVNLSAAHFARPELIADLKDILKTTGIDPRTLGLEITESTLMGNIQTISDNLSQIRELNIQLHIDDFGTGYSSLSYLHRFPVNTLKIDRSFVSDLELSTETRKIVQTIVALAQNLDMHVIAEGIETERQLKDLQSLGCHYGQGFLFSKPLDAKAAESLLTNGLPWLEAFEQESAVILPFVLEAG